MLALRIQSLPLLMAIILSTITFLPLVVRAGDVIRPAFGRANEAGKSTADIPGSMRLRFEVHVDPKHKSAIGPLLEALSVVASAAPKGVMLEGATSEDFEFAIEVTDAKALDADGLEPHQAQKAILESLPENAAHYTLIPSIAPRGPYIVRLFWDHLAYDQWNGVRTERQDAFTRTVVALVHEIYGNVRTAVAQRKLLEDPAHRYGTAYTRTDESLFQRSAFEASVAALQIVKKEARKAQVSDEIRKQIDRALAMETLGLARWIAVAEAATSVAAGASSSGPNALSATASLSSLAWRRCERVFNSN